MTNPILKMLSLLAISFFFLQWSNSKKSTSPKEGYHLVWSDEFNTGTLPDTSKWNYRVGDGCPELCGFGNRELQWYGEARSKNSRIKDGKLIIETHKEDIGTKHYSSARINSRHKSDWLYGRMEIWRLARKRRD